MLKFIWKVKYTGNIGGNFFNYEGPWLFWIHKSSRRLWKDTVALGDEDSQRTREVEVGQNKRTEKTKEGFEISRPKTNFLVNVLG